MSTNQQQHFAAGSRSSPAPGEASAGRIAIGLAEMGAAVVLVSIATETDGRNSDRGLGRGGARGRGRRQ